METRKPSRSGKYALVVGIAAGFVFLAMLFTALDTDASIADTLLAVGVCTSSMSIFLLSLEGKRKKSCKTSISNL